MALLFILMLPVWELYGQWHKLPVIPNAGSANRVSFPTANIGYLTASNGHVWKTTDAGLTWDKTYEIGALTGSEIYTFNDVHFIDSQRGFAVGYDLFGASYLILRTSDGGNSWVPYTSQLGFNIGECWALDFADAQTGYVVGDWGRIFKTTDGGSTWTPSGTPFATRLWDVDFVTPQLGWVLSIEGDLLKTTDGAATWQVVSTPIAFSRIQFLTAQVGFAVGDLRFFKTTDGGVTWLPVSESFPGSPAEFQFLDADVGFSFVGDRAIKTTDGGQTWYYQQVAPAPASTDFEGFSDLSILNADVGFMAGFQNNAGWVNTLLATTTNGGGIGLNVQLSTLSILCPGNEPITVTPQLYGGIDTLAWFLNGTALALPPTPQTFEGPWLSGENNTFTLRASTGDNVVEVERAFYVNFQPTSADFAWVSFQPQQPACHGQSMRVFTNYGFSEPLRLRQADGTPLASFQVGNTNGNYFFDSPPLFLPNTVFTVEVITPCGPVAIGELILPAYPPLALSLPLTTTANAVLCQTGNTIDLHVGNTLPNNGYQLFRNGNPEPSAFQNGTGGTIHFTSSPFDSTSSFTLLVYGDNNCVGTLDDTLTIAVERPSARFGTSGLNFEVGTPVEVSFAGQEAVAFDWDFGANATPATFNQQNPPPVNYTGTTATQIRLVVASPIGCRDTFVQNIGLYAPGNLDAFWAMEADISHQSLILGQNLAIDALGNVYIDGSSTGTTTGQAAETLLPTQAGAPGLLEKNRGTLLKYDRFGVLQWFLEFSGSNYGIRDLEPDALGNCYVPIGHDGPYYIGSTDGQRRYIQGPNGASLVKYAPNGHITWVAEVQACATESLTILDAELDATGNLVVLGRSGTCISFLGADGTPGPVLNDVVDSWLAKYTPDGQVLWAVPLQAANGVGHVYGHSLRIDPQGNLLVCGESLAAVAKFAPTGEFLWNVPVLGEEVMVVRNLDVDEAGNAYLAGMFRSRVAFEGVPEIDLGLPQHGSDYDLFVLKVSPSGQPLWLKSGAASNGYAENTAIRYHAGTVYVYGSYGLGQFEYDDLTLSSSAELSSLLLRIDASDGSYLTHQTFDAPSPNPGVVENYGCWGRTLAIDPTGTLYLIGNVGYEVPFENDTLRTRNWLFMAKTAGQPLVNTVTPVSQPSPWFAAVAPNPTEAAATLIIQLEQPEMLSATLLNVLGQVTPLFTNTHLPSGQHRIPISLGSGFPAGTYFIHLKNTAGITQVLRIIKV